MSNKVCSHSKLLSNPCSSGIRTCTFTATQYNAGVVDNVQTNKCGLNSGAPAAHNLAIASKSASSSPNSTLWAPSSSSTAPHTDIDINLVASPTAPSHAKAIQCVDKNCNNADASFKGRLHFGICSKMALLIFSNNSRAFASVALTAMCPSRSSSLLPPAAKFFSNCDSHKEGAFFSAAASRSKRSTLDPWNIAKCTVSPGTLF
mmetsp:Transcript_9793/g.17710  ORF Transcript_9793/g.17710 Transcript_9793/m.17710 type:complete len:204 (-) Transcript_9793:833-1444(-)